ncbi:Maf-like protein [Catellatospora methionotrophica]|uniref:Nucleoside triphosphate pyrophosphatase n=1 Tax=Catellatospora methionotrophica TaxID=121620 RepID=A0A8J3LC29_9ACTN|nr:nucleoside triphosphate pyrophosphatase [Catellatospora methionotrophica]GIG16010.1 Maf-like protein [Catellatospora methionotrophica]
MAARPTFILASASPARRTLLDAAGIDAEVIVSGVDEDAVEATTAEALSGVLARMKAHAVEQRLRHSAAAPERALVLGCDSVLAFDGQILGKPDDAEDAIKRWQAMRGRSGVLHTGHCLVELPSGRIAEEVGSTVVHFADLSDAEIEAYVATGEPLWVAGSFTIDGLGGPFVERIEGDHSNVVGLSLPLLRRLLATLDIPITELWRER